MQIANKIFEVTHMKMLRVMTSNKAQPSIIDKNNYKYVTNGGSYGDARNINAMQQLRQAKAQEF